MKRLCLILAAGLLTGCTTPAVKERVAEVDKPVAVYPVKPEQIPTTPAPLPKRPSSLSAAADLLLSDHCAWVAFGIKAFPLLRASANLPAVPLQSYPECENK